jgi:protein-disulfide isomerase
MAKKKRRKLSKAEARAEARRQKRQRQIIWAVAAVVAAAVVIVIVLIAVSGGGDGESGELVQADPPRSDVETGVTEEGYPYRGSADAPVTLVEFSDYNCPSCRIFALETAPVIDDELVATGQLRHVVQPYYLWDWSRPIVEAAMCAREQDGFWDYHHWLFANAERFPPQRSPSRGILLELAEASGLDTDAFGACLDEGRYRDEVVASTEDAKLKQGIDRTPTVFVNGMLTPATAEDIRNAVQAALSAGSSGGK